jgi:hypothetical protein
MPARRTVRDGNPGKIVHVAPKGGYDRFVPDEYRHHHGKERKYTK